MKFLEGKKTIISGVGLMVTALLGLAMHFADPLDPQALEILPAAVIFFNGLGFIGVKFGVINKIVDLLGKK